MRSREYGPDVLTGRTRSRPAPPELAAELGLVVEDPVSGWVGAVVGIDRDGVTLEDRHGRRRFRPYGVLAVDDAAVALTRPRPAAATPGRTASGSVAPAPMRARVARAGRIYVEGRHDAELVEQVWGEDLRVEGVVVEYMEGVDGLAAVVAAFRPGPGRRLGVLVDHLVPGSKESRLAAAVTAPDVLVVGHPYVDIWQAVRPAALGIPGWPVVARGTAWKDGVCAALGLGDPRAAWPRIRGAVRSYADLEPPLLAAVERLIDFVTA